MINGRKILFKKINILRIFILKGVQKELIKVITLEIFEKFCMKILHEII